MENITLEMKKFENVVKELREKIYARYKRYYTEFYLSHIFKHIDDYVNSETISVLEKAFYLMLYQNPTTQKDYFVVPNEMVLVNDVYDMSRPGFEYEIDFAIYGGPINNPLKVAIECDGLRSHGKKHKNKDRRKDVNLQVAGWIIMRFESKEIHQEINKIINEEMYISPFIDSIENTIAHRLEIVKDDNYIIYRNILTGYKWGYVKCTECGFEQLDILNHKNILCRNCNTKFKRVIDIDEEKSYEYNGILHFRN